MPRVIIVLSLLVCVTGCSVVNDPNAHRGGAPDGGVDGGVDAGPPPLPATQTCERLAEFWCDAYFGCCTDPERLVDTPENRQTCLDANSAQCAREFGPLITDGRTGYDEALAGVVLAEGYALVRGCAVGELLTWSTEKTGFQRVLTGTVERGEVCTPRSMAPFDTPALFSCEGSDSACVAGARDWRCLARSAVGESCVLYWDCQDGMRCTGLIGGTCEPRRANGSPCTGAVDCQSLFCDAGTCAAPTQNDVYCARG